MEYARRRRHGLLLLDFVGTILTGVAAVMLLFAYVAPYIHPGVTCFFAFFGLIAPVLYTLNGLLLLYWIVRWKFKALIPAFAILLGIGYISAFFKPHIGRVYEKESPRGSFSVMSYNVGGFLRHVDGSYLSSTRPILYYVRTENPDIICFQEFQTTPNHPITEIDRLLADWPNRQIYYTIQEGDIGLGLSVYSKYKIVNSGRIDFNPKSNNSAMWVDVRIGRDTVRIFNNHLQTTQLTEDNIAFLDPDNFVKEPQKKENFKIILKKLQRNYGIRADQADTLRELITASEMPVLVCGDHNDPPLSYTYRRVRGVLHDSFVEQGDGFHATYKRFLGLLRIDYIFYEDPLVCSDLRTLEAEWSDHDVLLGRYLIEHSR